jgi:hypothetical protein
MKYSWAFINRRSERNRLVIPGWSLLPHYFARLFPTDNLIILNPFIAQKSHYEYLNNIQFNYEFIFKDKSIDQVLNDRIDSVFIFSMGLQWVLEHASQCFDWPCDIVSPAIRYHHNELDHLILSLKKSVPITLKSFYRQCFYSHSEWLWWKQHMLNTHIEFNNSDTLIHWLEHYGRMEVTIPDLKETTIWFDPNDKIGIKPMINPKSLTIYSHLNGHILTDSTINQLNAKLS